MVQDEVSNYGLLRHYSNEVVKAGNAARVHRSYSYSFSFSERSAVCARTSNCTEQVLKQLVGLK